MNEGRSVRGVVVAHGPMARAMVDAVRRIAGGAADALVPLSNESLGPTELKAALERVIGDDAAIVFTDLESGSCGMAAVSSCRDRGRRVVVCGVNLPMLLDFVFHAETPMDELVDRVIDRGRASIMSPLVRS